MYKDDAFIRARERALKDGIVAVYDSIKDRYITNSKSDPGTTHKVLVKGTNYLCDCTGFFRFGMCKHIAATFEEQLRLRRLMICPNCGAVLQCYPHMDIPTYEFHVIEKRCINTNG